MVFNKNVERTQIEEFENNILESNHLYIPGRIRKYSMIKINLKGDFRIKQEDLFDYSLEKLLSIDCWMIIKINDKIFYSDWICPLEFFAQYKKWKEEKGLNLKKSFQYVTTDNSENPILSFFWSPAKKSWYIDSCLKKYIDASAFSDEDLYCFFKQFENEIETHVI